MLIMQTYNLQGQDGMDLLHRISTLPIKGAKSGFLSMGFLLDPKGLILSSFGFLLDSSTQATLLFFGLDKDTVDHQSKSFLAVMDQYTFSERYEITPQNSDSSVLSKFKTLALPGAEESVTFGRLFTHTEKSFSVDHQTIHSLTPLPGHELNSLSSPLESGFAPLFTTPKGCYPGQEVIEKVLSLGSPAKRLVQIQFAPNSLREIAENAALNVGGAEVGRLTRWDESSGLALAMVRKSNASVGTKLTINSNSSLIEAVISKVSKF